MSEKDSGTKVPSNGDIHRQKGALKTARIPIKIQPAEKLPKPGWIRVKAGSYSSHFHEVKNLLKEQELVTVCDEAELSEPGRMLRERDSRFHGDGRQVYTSLSFL